MIDKFKASMPALRPKTEAGSGGTRKRGRDSQGTQLEEAKSKRSKSTAPPAMKAKAESKGSSADVEGMLKGLDKLLVEFSSKS